MKKLIIGLLFILLISSCTVLFINYQNSNKYDEETNQIENEIKTEDKNIEDLEEKIEELNKEYEILAKENAEKIEVYEKWQKKLKEIKDLL